MYSHSCTQVYYTSNHISSLMCTLLQDSHNNRLDQNYKLHCYILNYKLCPLSSQGSNQMSICRVSHNPFHPNYNFHRNILDYTLHHSPYPKSRQEHSTLLADNLPNPIHNPLYYTQSHNTHLLTIGQNMTQHMLLSHSLLHLTYTFHSYTLLNIHCLLSYLYGILKNTFLHSLFHHINMLHCSILSHSGCH